VEVMSSRTAWCKACKQQPTMADSTAASATAAVCAQAGIAKAGAVQGLLACGSQHTMSKRK
jgi:hypothetical protein